MSHEDHRAKMKRNFHKFKIVENVKKHKANNKHASEKSSNPLIQQIPVPVPIQKSIPIQSLPVQSQLNEYDLLHLMKTDLPPTAFVPNFAALFNGNYPFGFDINQAVPPPETDLLNQNPQTIPMIGPIVQSPIAQTVDPIVSNIQMLSITTPPSSLPVAMSPPQISERPSRPDPPKLKDGPVYVVPSADFIAYFKTIDEDDSGTITFTELKKYLYNKGANRNISFNDQTIWTLIEMFDTNGDKVIDKKEFPEFLAYINNWEQCFLFLDSDRSGTINYKEMHTAIQGLGLLDFGGICISQLLREHDPTGKEEIDFDNFILVCISVVRYHDTYQFMQKTFGEYSMKGFGLEDLITGCLKRMFPQH